MMTNQEAIEILKSIKASFETDEWLQNDIKALEKGIEALESQKTIIDELEKLKEKIEDRYHKEMIKRHADNGYDYQDLLLIGIDIGKNIVDRHIIEMKGE